MGETARILDGKRGPVTAADCGTGECGGVLIPRGHVGMDVHARSPFCMNSGIEELGNCELVKYVMIMLIL